MGPRRLLKQGSLTKAKSGRKLQAFLCSDVLVLTDEGVNNLYRMVRGIFHLNITAVSLMTFCQPIPLANAQVKESKTRGMYKSLFKCMLL